MVNQDDNLTANNDLRIGCTKEEMMMRIENYLPYLVDDDLKVISVQLYNISKRRQDIQRQQAMLEERKENG